MITLIIAGRLGRDAESKDVGGKTVTNFSVAHSKSWIDKQTGERKSQTVWVNCTRWSENTGVNPYLKKGVAVCIEGEPSTRAWVDNAGKACASLELNVRTIELMGKAENNEPAAQQRSQAPQQTSNRQVDAPPPPFVDNKHDDYSDLPF